MYEKHFGLDRKPFSIVPNPEILFLSKNHENALTYLEYGLTEKVGFILLTGDIGTGKTTLVRHMVQKMEAEMEIAVIFNTNFSSDQLFRLILSEFEVPCETTEKEKHLELLYQYLIDRYAKRKHVLLIIDEAQNLSATSLEDIRMLSNLQTDDRILLQIMLVGQPELKTKLQQPNMRQLSQRIAVNYHLTALTEKQTEAYIAYRIVAAGGAPDLFTRQAVQFIHGHSHGVPRTINMLCDSALVYAYADDKSTVDHHVVEQILRDKTCLAAIEETPLPPSVAAATLPAHIGERIAAVETTLADLARRHDALEREVRHELLFKYQELLIAERKRNDELLAKYTQLLRRHRDALLGNGYGEAAEVPPTERSAGQTGERNQVEASDKSLFGKIWRMGGEG